MKKKVFFIMSTNDYSGAEAVNFSIIEGLKDKYDFYWVSKRGKINSYLEEKKINWIEIKKISFKEIRRIVNKYHPDILHATDYNASFISCISCQGVPVVSHIHNNAHWIKKINIKSLLFLITALKVKKILTVSNAIENEYIFSRFIKDKIKCIYNPISYSKINDKLKLSQIKKDYDICCCARLSEPKDPIRFLNIISKIKMDIPNVRAIWIGDGELKQKVLAEAEKLKLTGNIDFIGKKKNPYKYMARAKVFLLTSKWEGFGLAAYEAIALGLPAVVTNVGGLSYIVDDTCGFLCNDNEEIIKGILFLLTNRKAYEEYCINAVSKAKKIDNINIYMKELNNIYNEL